MKIFAPRQFIITSGIFTRLSQSPFPETKVTSMVHALQVVVMLSHKDNYDNLSSYSKTHNFISFMMLFDLSNVISPSAKFDSFACLSRATNTAASTCC